MYKDCFLCVQRIMATVNNLEQKRLLMDLDINMRSGSCPYTVEFYGALFREVSASVYIICTAPFKTRHLNPYIYIIHIYVNICLQLCYRQVWGGNAGWRGVGIWYDNKHLRTVHTNEIFRLAEYVWVISVRLWGFVKTKREVVCLSYDGSDQSVKKCGSVFNCVQSHLVVFPKQQSGLWFTTKTVFE